MKNWQKVIFFVFFTVFAMSFSASLHADEDTATMQTEPDEEIGVEESTAISPKAEQQMKLDATTLPDAIEVESASSAPSVEEIKNPASDEPVQSATVPSGLVEVEGFKYPVYLFIPKDYKTDRTYAMIMIAPAENMKAQDQIEYLTGLAQRKSIFILAPYVLWPKSGTTPYQLDDWLLSVKRDITERFPINKNRVYLLGKDSGAQYAGYLGAKYPQEFSAVALIGEAWDGPFSQLVRQQWDAHDKVPFFVALKAGGEAMTRNQVWLDAFQKKGYPLHLVEYKNDEELADLEFKKSVFDWMEATSQSWAVSVAQKQKTWKGKFKKGVKDFFAV
jgi:predicted peptidase